MIKIGDFSKLSRISIRMLRHYNEIGLLMPDSIDNFTGYRYYSAAQLPLANRIGALKDMGFSLAAIMEILNNPEALRKLLTLKYAETKEQMENVTRQMLLLETTINRLGKDEGIMTYDVVLKEIPQRYVASVRKIIPTYQEERILWEQMQKETGCALKMANPCYSLAVFHDESHKENDVDVEIQIAIQGQHENTENVVFKTVEPIEVASVVYKGSYDQINEANQSVAAWVSDNGYDYDGPILLIYHVSPGHDPNPDNWVTEVCYPVRKK